MAAKAVDASKCVDRNRRFRGHGPLLRKAWTIPSEDGTSTAPVGAAHGRESGERKAT